MLKQLCSDVKSVRIDMEDAPHMNNIIAEGNSTLKFIEFK